MTKVELKKAIKESLLSTTAVRKVQSVVITFGKNYKTLHDVHTINIMYGEIIIESVQFRLTYDRENKCHRVYSFDGKANIYMIEAINNVVSYGILGV